MSKSYDDCLSTRIRLGNATTKEEALADAATELLAFALKMERYHHLIPTELEEARQDAIAKAGGGA